MHELKYAARQLIRSPLFTLVAAVSVGIGITVAVTIFSLLNSVLFKPLPLPDADQVVHVLTNHPTHDTYASLAYADLPDLQRSGAFKAIAAHSGRDVTVAVAGEAPRWAHVTFVSPNFFQALELRLAHGRTFSVDGSVPEIIISDQYRRRVFGDVQSALGATIRVNNMPVTVIGVAPASFHGLRTHVGHPAVGWMAAEQRRYVYGSSSELDDRTLRYFGVIARVSKGSTIAQASSRLSNTSRELARDHPTVWRDNRGAPLRIVLLTHQELLKPRDTDSISGLALISIIVFMVLALACTNVAGLLLARAISRRHEIAVRLALGASRARLLRQLLTESVLLAIVGGALGFLGAQATLQFLARKPVFDAFDLSPDWRVFAITGGVSLLCAAIFGITPAGQALKVSVKDGLLGHGIVGERGGVRGRLIALQVCMSCLLILIAISATRGVRSQVHTDRAFQVDGLLVAALELGGFRSDTALKRQYVDDVRTILKSTTGVSHTTTSQNLPLSNSDGGEIDVELPGAGKRPIRYLVVGDDYFETMGIRLMRGRPLQREDALSTSKVIVVNRAFVEAYGVDVLGRTIMIGQNQPALVVGIVDDVKHRALDLRNRPYLYQARKENDIRYIHRLHVVARVRPDLIQPAATQLIRGLHDRYPNRVSPLVEPLRTTLERDMAPQRVVGNVALAIGGIELILGAIGLYGMLLYALMSRTREVGLRMALGARSHHASFTVLGDGLRFVAIGSLMGMILCVPAAMFAARNFIGVKASDPWPFAFALLAVAVSSFAAATVPAIRAARVEPMVALRHE